MRKYYLFLIKNQYLKEPEYLIYQIMENLYHLNKNSLDYGLTCYNQLCDDFNVDLIKDYLQHKFEDNILTINSLQYLVNTNNEKFTIKLNNKFILIITDVNMPIIFKYLNCYNKNIFVCDFVNKDYFWLHNLYSNPRKKTYI